MFLESLEIGGEGLFFVEVSLRSSSSSISFTGDKLIGSLPSELIRVSFCPESIDIRTELVGEVGAESVWEGRLLFCLDKDWDFDLDVVYRL